MYQYLRIMRMLCGPKIEPLISNKKCVEYFHNVMGYPVQMRTKKGGASLAKDSLYKLRLKVENPVIDFLIKYRETQKETGTLNFKVWLPTDEMKTPSQGQLI
jgi:DNA polymerase I-like protein with 3'-5' exonuclease and polymerase domains